jgi:hypothetical protein
LTALRQYLKPAPHCGVIHETGAQMPLIRFLSNDFGVVGKLLDFIRPGKHPIRHPLRIILLYKSARLPQRPSVLLFHLAVEGIGGFRQGHGVMPP